jgi:tol-pal system protein YbgF
MKKLAVAAILLTAACASTSDTTNPSPDYVPAPQQANDTNVAELQTAMTELLERLDVLNARLAKLENAAPVAVPNVAAAAPAAEVPRAKQIPAQVQVPAAEAAVATSQTPQPALVGAKIADDYRNALMLYGKNRVADSRRAFQDVFDADPTGELADNALYWIGETYFAAGDFTNASKYYRRVTTEFADQNKAPDALYKIAVALERTGDLALARKTLQEVIERYPYSTPAASAKHELTRIKF